jgi:hypothetical protein
MGHAKRLEKASGIFFVLGFTAAQMQRLPFVALGAISNVVTLLSYFLGYILWLAACQFHPDHPGRKNFWYGFTQFKNQHRAAAIVGTIAVFISLIAFSLPLAIVPACWLFAASNCIWLISEYHKKKNIFNHEQGYSASQQNSYLHYSALTTALSLVTATATTVSLLFPIAAPVTIGVSVIIGIFLATFALHYWLEHKLTTHQSEKQSHTILTNKLGAAYLSNKLTSRLSLSATAEDWMQDDEEIELMPLTANLSSSSILECPANLNHFEDITQIEDNPEQSTSSIQLQ